MLTTLLDMQVFGARIVLDAYPTVLYGGAALGVALALLFAGARGLPLVRSAAVLVSAAFAVPAGARALHVFTDAPLFAENPQAAFEVALTGFGIYGGLTAAVAVAVLGTRIARLDLWRLADAAAPGIAAGLVCAKLACYCEGCCHGITTEGPRGVVFPPGSPSHAAQLIDGTVGLLASPLAVHPTQLYEAAGALVLGVLAAALGPRLPDGVAFLSLAAGFSAVRMGVLPYRWIEPSFSAPDWFYPVFYGVLIALSLVLGLNRLLAREMRRVGAEGSAP